MAGIPMNFNWRAGIGTSTQQSAPQTTIGIGQQVNPQYTTVPNKSEVYQSVLGEAMYVVNSFISQYYGRQLSVNDSIIVKSSIQNKLVESLGFYKKYLDVDFITYANNYIIEKDLRGIVDKPFIINCLNKIVTHQPQQQQMINE